jgi:hypothetical protein
LFDAVTVKKKENVVALLEKISCAKFAAEGMARVAAKGALGLDGNKDGGKAKLGKDVKITFTDLQLDKAQYFYTPNSPVVVDKTTIDCSFTPVGFTWKHTVRGLQVPTQIYSLINPNMGLFSERNKTLQLSFDADCAAAWEDDDAKTTKSIDITNLYFGSDDFAAVQLQAALAYLGDASMKDVGRELFLKSASLRLTDKALVENVLIDMNQANGAPIDAQAIQELRKQEAAKMATKEAKDAFTKLLQKPLSQLILAPGTLSIVLSPKKPVPVSQIGDPAVSGIVVTYEPLEKAGQ